MGYHGMFTMYQLVDFATTGAGSFAMKAGDFADQLMGLSHRDRSEFAAGIFGDLAPGKNMWI